jgi:hypothetical protein
MRILSNYEYTIYRITDGDNHHSCQIADTIILMFSRTLEFMVSQVLKRLFYLGYVGVIVGRLIKKKGHS